MISYLVATVPWTLGCLSLSPPNHAAVKWRKRFGGTFFATLIPLIYFFIQHKVHKVPGGRILISRLMRSNNLKPTQLMRFLNGLSFCLTSPLMRARFMTLRASKS